MMTLADIKTLIDQNGLLVGSLALAAIPATWAVAQFMYKHQVENAKALLETKKLEVETLKEQIKKLESSAKGASLSSTPSSKLKESLVTWVDLIQRIGQLHQHAMQNSQQWPGTSVALVNQENALYSTILSSLDRGKQAQDDLARQMNTLKNLADPADWYTQREILLSLVGPALAE